MYTEDQLKIHGTLIQSWLNDTIIEHFHPNNGWVIDEMPEFLVGESYRVKNWEPMYTEVIDVIHEGDAQYQCIFIKKQDDKIYVLPETPVLSINEGGVCYLQLEQVTSISEKK